MANILYISCHSVLEYDEIRLLTALGHSILSIGSYFIPGSPAQNIRPPLRLHHKSIWIDIFYSTNCSVSPLRLSYDFLNMFDIVISMHNYDILMSCIKICPQKDYFWRGIGQATPHIEAKLKELRKTGVKLIRYSPMESKTIGFAGQDALIRFCKKESEFISNEQKIDEKFLCYNGITQRSKYNDWELSKDFVEANNFNIFGGSNELLKNHRGFVSTEDQLNLFKTNSQVFCLSSYPAPYTLGFLEAVMSNLEIFICKNGHESDERFMFGQDYKRVAGNIFSFVANRELKDMFSEKNAKISWNKLLG